MKNSIRTAAVVSLLCALGAAQNPFALPSQAGPLSQMVTVPGGVTYNVAAGYTLTHLFSLSGIITNAGDMVVGSGGHLYVTPVAGNACQTTPTVHIRSVQMQGTSPVLPLVTAQFTTIPIPAFQMVYDPVTKDIFACGTCDQTNAVYRIGPTGSPSLLNAGSPFNDPDGIAFGRLRGRPNPYVFVAAQDALYAIDITGPQPVIQNVPVDLSAVGLTALANWGSLLFDHRTGTLLAANVGANMTYRTIEIAFTVNGSALSGVATQLFPTTMRPMAIDDRGARIFEQGQQIGYLDGSGPTAALAPILGGLSGATVEVAPDGSFLILDQFVGNVLRLEPTLRSQTIPFSSALGGTIDFKISGPPGRASETYLLLVGASGSSPGVPWGTSNVPLNFDSLTSFVYQLTVAQHPLLSGWSGMLDAAGKAQASVTLPPGALPPNATLVFAYLLGSPSATSNSVWIHTF